MHAQAFRQRAIVLEAILPNVIIEIQPLESGSTAKQTQVKHKASQTPPQMGVRLVREHRRRNDHGKQERHTQARVPPLVLPDSEAPREHVIWGLLWHEMTQ